MNTVSTITVSGPDSFEFLQGQLTNDLRRLDDEAAIMAGWCNPKGRVICVMIVIRTADGFALTVPTDLTGEIVKRLNMFRFRSRVDFEILPETAVVSISEEIENGMPFISLEQTERFTPHMLNLDLLDAINFDKGCYTGQEIVARTHYKGATKRRAMRFSYAGSVSVGDKVSNGERDIGEVLNVADNALLAVIPVDEADGTLSVNGVELTADPLPYM